MSCYKYIVIQSKVRSFGQWAAATCAVPPSVIAGQYATSNCKPLLVIECRWRYINVETFDLFWYMYVVCICSSASLVIWWSLLGRGFDCEILWSSSPPTCSVCYLLQYCYLICTTSDVTQLTVYLETNLYYSIAPLTTRCPVMMSVTRYDVNVS